MKGSHERPKSLRRAADRVGHSGAITGRRRVNRLRAQLQQLLHGDWVSVGHLEFAAGGRCRRFQAEGQRWDYVIALTGYVFFLASCWLPTVPHVGWIKRWFQISVGLQAISCILLGAWLFDEFQSGWLTAAVFLLLSFGLIALHAGIHCLGRELHAPSLVQPACVAMGSLGLAVMFFLLGMYADYISARDACEALLVFGSLCLLISYIACLISLGFAWKMPRVISERMQRCFPLRLAEGQNPASQFLQDLQQQETDQGSRSVSGNE